MIMLKLKDKDLGYWFKTDICHGELKKRKLVLRKLNL